ncbi:MAG: hypothetical protein U0802_02370 [Candidatus Binatia bacterium]
MSTPADKPADKPRPERRPRRRPPRRRPAGAERGAGRRLALPAHPRRLEYRVAWNGISRRRQRHITPGERDGAPSLEVEARGIAFVDLFWSFLAARRRPACAPADRRRWSSATSGTMAGTPYLTWVD